MNPIYITKPEMPPLEDFQKYLSRIWETRQLTNCGEFHEALERRLCEYLGVDNISLFSNATLALVTALRYLRVTGEVITSPFSFVATSNSIIWANSKPVFADIEKDGFNLDADLIEKYITDETRAIMPVHCYGFPCDVDKIEKVAGKYNLKVIYDAAHAFGIKINGRSVLTFGDMSILSFHATKVFNTFEGGAIISRTKEDKIKIDNLRNFGFSGDGKVTEIGINAKMSEIHAAFGLANLDTIDDLINKRLFLEIKYRDGLSSIPGLMIKNRDSTTNSNGSYVPIIVEAKYGITRDEIFNRFKSLGIFTRRYFYPLITDMDAYKYLGTRPGNSLRNARDASDRILCLPIYPSLEDKTQELIIAKLREWQIK